ncbi:hypothetical protein JCM16303_003137 [Sporobolomyces ruberrimus]
MELNKPYAVYSKSDQQTEEANKDYSMTSPLEKDGSNYPAKKRCTSEILSALTPVATLVSGEDFEWSLAGTAVHNGGSCQVGITYDNCETIAVMASYIGGCPLSLPYSFKIPDLPGADKAFFVWAWSNKSGNRELYQSVAVVAVEGSASKYVGPRMFRANTFGDGSSCINPEGTDVVYPAPGDQVFYAGDYSDSSPPSAAKLDCPDYDNSETVTVKNSGGSGPTGGSGGDKSKTDTEATATGSATSSGGGDNSESSGSSTATGTGSGTKSSDSAAETGSAGSSSSGGAGGTDDDAEETGGGGDTAPSSNAPSGDSSSTTAPSSTSSGSSDADSAEFVKFGVAVLALIALGGVAVCFFRKRSTSTASYSHPEDTDSSDGNDSDSSDSSYRAEKHRSRRHMHGRRHRH